MATFGSIAVSAQTIEKFYDINFHECSPELSRFYSQVTKTDSGWLRNDYYSSTATLQMTGLYEDSSSKIRTGYFVFYYPNGIPENMGRYEQNKMEGLWTGYWPNGMKKDSAVYSEDRRTGTALGWYSDGYLSDSTVYNSDGTAVAVAWGLNGSPSEAGYLKDKKLHGAWQFFHPNGQLAAKELYDTGRLVSAQYFDTTGLPQKKATKDRYASFPGGRKAWKKFILKHMSFPPEYKIVNGTQVTLLVRVIVDEEGNLFDPYVSIPLHKVFDGMALDIFKKSPKWVPAIKHNRAVRFYASQPITLLQGE